MKKIWILIFTIFLLAAMNSNASANGKKAKSLPHFHEGITKVSENGYFSIEIVPDPLKPKTGKNYVKVYLHDSDGKDLEDAKVDIEVWNKGKAVQSTEKSKTRETAQGEYIVRNIVYESAGIYELIVKVTKGNESDRAVFEIEVKE